MNKKVLCVYFLGGFLILYFLTICIIQVGDNKHISTLFGTSCDLLKDVDSPQFAIAERKVSNSFTHYLQRFTLDQCKVLFIYGKQFDLKYRPVVGDHIHIGYSVSLFGHEIILKDRNMTQPVPYEEYKPIDECISPPEYAYVKKWYHTGVHTHCDQIIHVHPWSAPKQLRVEGKDVTLKMWFESVGIEVGSLLNTLKIPGNPYYSDWTLEYYVNVTDENPALVTKNVDEMANLWLVDHHAFIKLYNGEVPDKNTRVLEYASVSKIGSKYPSRYL